MQAAVASSHDFDEFTTRLAGDGVTVWPRMSTQQPDQITGYSVSLNDWTNAAGEPVRFGGGKLAPDLSWPKLHARWGLIETTERQAGGAGTGTAAGGRASDAAGDADRPRGVRPRGAAAARRARRRAGVARS
ncbi:hypothetical protein [Jatrophihabitans endophyticus]|uniref:hypothetical protein n=1 Tax=Jatrophihabitans endophyticus TaxID=1206085 RepID=UPI00093540B2|nr:hypothetical protein [Jatrophihabitans endophyticus]